MTEFPGADGGQIACEVTGLTTVAGLWTGSRRGRSAGDNADAISRLAAWRVTGGYAPHTRKVVA
jgi:hypothetical protein